MVTHVTFNTFCGANSGLSIAVRVFAITCVYGELILRKALEEGPFSIQYTRFDVLWSCTDS